MQEPTHAPGWRGRPPYYGDLEGQHDEADRLQRIAAIGCGVMAIGTSIVALVAWVADTMAHL